MLEADFLNCSMNLVYEDPTTGKKEREEVAPYYEVVRIIKKIPEGVECEEAEFLIVTAANTAEYCRISLEDLTDMQITMKTLARHYFFVKSKHKNLVYDDIQERVLEKIRNKQFSYEHKCLGWQDINGKEYFLHDYTDIGNGNISTCTRNCGQFRNGNESDYDLILNQYVFNNTAMSLAYVLGFTGVIVSRLSQVQDLGVLIAGLSGRSTTGKTTALKLIASIWGNPDDVKGTIIIKNNASELGLTSQYSGLFGVPICFDDLNTNTKIKMSDFLYELSRGSQRVIANTKGESNYSRMGFSGISIITGETPLLSQTEQKMGLYARIIDFTEIAWTIDGQSASELKKKVGSHYGFKGCIFGEYIQNFDTNTLSDEFDTCVNVINNLIVNKDEFTHRISKKYAAILLTLRLLNKCFNISLDEKEIMKLALSCEEEQQRERNKSTLSYECIYEYFKNNEKKFDVFQGNKGFVKSLATGNRDGIANYKSKKELHLYITISKVKEILKENNFFQLNSYKVKWKEKGYIMCEKNRYDMSNPEVGRHFHFVYQLDNIGGEQQ